MQKSIRIFSDSLFSIFWICYIVTYGKSMLSLTVCYYSSCCPAVSDMEKAVKPVSLFQPVMVVEEYKSDRKD